MICKQVPRKMPLKETLWTFHNVTHYTLYWFTVPKSYLEPSGSCGDRDSCSAEMSPACHPYKHRHEQYAHRPCFWPMSSKYSVLSNFAPFQTKHRLWIQITKLSLQGFNNKPKAILAAKGWFWRLFHSFSHGWRKGEKNL